jgi:autotransporter-associated beta strand protein
MQPAMKPLPEHQESMHDDQSIQGAGHLPAESTSDRIAKASVRGAALRNPFSASAFFGLTFLAGVAMQTSAQAASATWVSNVNGTPDWLTNSSWSTNNFPGTKGDVSTNIDVATFDASGTSPTIGIGFSNGTNNNFLSVGRITVATGPRTVGGSGAVAGTLRLNGDAGGTIISVTGNSTLTLQPSVGGSNMSIVLGNTTNNIIDVATGSTANITTTIGNASGVTNANLTKTGGGNLTLSGTNTYSGMTTLSGGTTTAGNNAAFGTGTLAFNGGALASNGTRTLANAITVNSTGGSITGANDITLTGTATGAGTLTVNMNNAASTVTVNNTFAPAAINLTQGTLLLGSSDRIGNSTAIILNGGKLSTGGFNDTVGALTLSASSTIDMGTSAGSTLTFNSLNYTAGTLTIANWTGSPSPGSNTDFIYFTTDPTATNPNFLNNVVFSGFYGDTPGSAEIIQDGNGFQLKPIPEPGTVFGGLALVGLVGFRERRRFKFTLKSVRGLGRLLTPQM